MASTATIRKLIQTRLTEASILRQKNCFEGAKYLCGFAVEHALKLQICKTLRWSHYPPLRDGESMETKENWNGLKDFKIHDLDILLILSGKSKELGNSKTLATAWRAIKENWNPEIKYQISPKTLTDLRRETMDMIGAAKKIIAFLKKRT